MQAKTYGALINNRKLTAKPKNLAAKIALSIAATFGVATMPAQAGIPVIDGTNLTQTTVTAFQQVAQVQKQIEQYRTQLQQYETCCKTRWPRPPTFGIRRSPPSTG